MLPSLEPATVHLLLARSVSVMSRSNKKSHFSSEKTYLISITNTGLLMLVVGRAQPNSHKLCDGICYFILIVTVYVVTTTIYMLGARGSVKVKKLNYKPEGRGFETP
jgi:hypothetical protein